MSIAVTDRITRGANNTSPFAIAWEEDMKISNITVANDSERDNLPIWRRTAFMSCKVISSASNGGARTTYELGADTSIAGQVWTIQTFGVPSNVVTEDEIFDVNGFIQPQLIQ